MGALPLAQAILTKPALTTASLFLALTVAAACGSEGAAPSDGEDAATAAATATAKPTQSPLLLPVTPTLVVPSTTPQLQRTEFIGAGSQEAESNGDADGFESSPADALVLDGREAADMDSGTNAANSCFNAGKDRHLFSDFNIGLPAGATIIDGIEVGLPARADSSVGIAYFCAQLSWDGGVHWTEPRRTAQLTETSTMLVAGLPLDRWGRSWLTSDLSQRNLRLRVISVADHGLRDFFLDWVAIRVTYH